jgi:hypothetical protein
LLQYPALPAGSTCSTPLARLPHSQPGPPVVFIPLARYFAGFPLRHARPGPPVVFIGVARYFFVALSPGRRPGQVHPPTGGTPVAHCFTGLSHWTPRPARVGLDPRFHILRISMKCIYGENYLKFFIFWLTKPYIYGVVTDLSICSLLWLAFLPTWVIFLQTCISPK